MHNLPFLIVCHSPLSVIQLCRSSVIVCQSPLSIIPNCISSSQYVPVRMLICWSRLCSQDTSHHKVAILLFHGYDLVSLITFEGTILYQAVSCFSGKYLPLVFQSHILLLYFLIINASPGHLQTFKHGRIVYCGLQLMLHPLIAWILFVLLILWTLINSKCWSLSLKLFNCHHKTHFLVHKGN